jgi:hypothetical protein
MNTVIHPSEKKPLRYSNEEGSLRQAPVHQLKPQAFHKAVVPAKQQPQLLHKIKSQLLPAFLIIGLGTVVTLWLGADDVIKKEGYKALALVILLLQMKYFTNSIKQQ